MFACCSYYCLGFSPLELHNQREIDVRAAMAPPREPKPRRKQRKKSGACGWLLGREVIWPASVRQLMRCCPPSGLARVTVFKRHHGTLAILIVRTDYVTLLKPLHTIDPTRSAAGHAGARMACPAFGCPRPIRHRIVSLRIGSSSHPLLFELTACLHLCSDFFLNIILTCLGGLLHPRGEAEGGRTPIIVILQLMRRRTHAH